MSKPCYMGRRHGEWRVSSRWDRRHLGLPMVKVPLYADPASSPNLALKSLTAPRLRNEKRRLPVVLCIKTPAKARLSTWEAQAWRVSMKVVNKHRKSSWTKKISISWIPRAWRQWVGKTPAKSRVIHRSQQRSQTMEMLWSMRLLLRKLRNRTVKK